MSKRKLVRDIQSYENNQKGSTFKDHFSTYLVTASLSIFSGQEFQNFKNWKWEVENIFCIVCELKDSVNHPYASFKKLWVGGWWLICDYSVSSAPFVSELRL